MSDTIIQTPWTSADLIELRRLWVEESLSTAEISRRLKRTKNSVIGKVHYLNLPGRPSPIAREGKPAPVREQYRKKYTAEVCRLKREGRSLKQIGRCVGISHSTVYVILKENGMVQQTISAARSVPKKTLPAPDLFTRTAVVTTPPPEPKPIVRRRSSLEALFNPHNPIPPARSCCYVYGDVRERNWWYCDKPTKEGSSYCPECHDKCYTRVSKAEAA